MLPLLVVADCFGVYYHNKNVRWGRLRQLFPPVLVGLVLGSLVLERLTNKQFSIFLGIIILLLLSLEFLRNTLQCPNYHFTLPVYFHRVIRMAIKGITVATKNLEPAKCGRTIPAGHCQCSTSLSLFTKIELHASLIRPNVIKPLLQYRHKNQ